MDCPFQEVACVKPENADAPIAHALQMRYNLDHKRVSHIRFASTPLTEAFEGTTTSLDSATTLAGPRLTCHSRQHVYHASKQNG